MIIQCRCGGQIRLKQDESGLIPLEEVRRIYEWRNTHSEHMNLWPLTEEEFMTKAVKRAGGKVGDS